MEQHALNIIACNIVHSSYARLVGKDEFLSLSWKFASAFNLATPKFVHDVLEYSRFLDKIWYYTKKIILTDHL